MNDKSTNQIPYRVMADGTSLGVSFGPAPKTGRQRFLTMMDHASSVSVQATDLAFNRAVKRGRTILVSGDLPRLALMVTQRGATVEPKPLKLADVRIRIQCGSNAFWLDEADRIDTTFHPASTTYIVSHNALPGLQVRLDAALTVESAVVIGLAIANDGTAALPVKLTWISGGMKEQPRTFSGAYCQVRTDDGISNQMQCERGTAIVCDPSIPWVLAMRLTTGAIPITADGRMVFSEEVELLPGKTHQASLVLGHADNAESAVLAVHRIDILDQVAETAVYFDDLLKRSVLRTPSAILNAGFRIAVLNLEYIHEDRAWLEGVHYWLAPWVNNYQISAATVLDQLDRARTALEYFDHPDSGPCPIRNSDGSCFSSEAMGVMAEDGLPYYIHSLNRYVQHTGDLDLLKRVWPGLMRGLTTLMAHRDADGDHMLDWRRGSNAFLYQADHLGMPGCSASANLMMSGMLARVADLGQRIGEDEQSARWRRIGADMLRQLPNLWNAEQGVFNNHIDHQGLAHATHYYTDCVFPILYSDLDERYGWQSLDYLRRNLCYESPRPDGPGNLLLMRVGEMKPSMFGNDNVMPTQMAEAARAFFAQGQGQDGFRLLEAVALAGSVFTESPGNFPERMGDDGLGLPNFLFGNPIGSFLEAVIDGLFGLAIQEMGTALRWCPGFPDDWDHAELTLAYAQVTYRRHQEGEQIVRDYRIRHNQPRSLVLTLHLEPGESEVRDANDRTFDAIITPVPGRTLLALRLPPAAEHQFRAVTRPSVWQATGPEQAESSQELWYVLPGQISQVSDPLGLLSHSKICGSQLHAIAGPAGRVGRFYVWMEGVPTIVPVTLAIDPPLRLSWPRPNTALCQLAEPMALGQYYNAQRIRARSAWGTANQPNIEPQRGADGLIHTPAGRFAVPATGMQMVILELGICSPDSQAIVASDFPSVIEIPVRQQVRAINLLYVSEIEARLSRSRVGEIRLLYDDGQIVTVPLVAGRNIQTLRGYFALDSVPLGDVNDSPCLILHLACRDQVVLKAISLHVDVVDTTLALMGVNLVPADSPH